MIYQKKFRFPRHVRQAEKDLIEASENPDVYKLYHMIRSCKGSMSQSLYESMKKYISRTPGLSKDYEKWIKLVIDFLNV
jgi:hypothetical protein